MATPSTPSTISSRIAASAHTPTVPAKPQTGELFERSPLAQNPQLQQRLALNYRRNHAQDHTAKLAAAAQAFDYNDWREVYWQAPELSLLYGTPVWDQASPSQRLALNHLYWVAYYAQIIAAEIATIYFNQVSATGLYALEGCRDVCTMLDLESTQERAHISAFRTVGEQVEQALFGRAQFLYPMRSPFSETMIFADATPFQRRWKQLQLKAFGLIAADNAFLACQYFTVRGLRTLNGKLIQHQLSQFAQSFESVDAAPIPSRISHYHFMDESFHFNSSTLLSHGMMTCLPQPTTWEAWVANRGIQGCQQDHAQFSVAINGIFWHDPALYGVIYAILRSPVFGLDAPETLALMQACFTTETAGLHRSYVTHQEALAAYRVYLEPIHYAWGSNREMVLMAKSSSIARYLGQNRRSWRRFQVQAQAC